MSDYTNSNLRGTRRPFYVGTGTPNDSAALQVDSLEGGLLIPRITTVERLAIVSPAESLLVYDTDLTYYCSYKAGTWRQVLESIEEDTSFYVDGTTGNDNNDGLSWATAKQTFGFLLPGEPDSIPRCLNGNVTVNFRNEIRARNARGVLNLEGFYGGGSLFVVGVLTAEDTFVATGYDNNFENRKSRVWVSDATKAWTPDQWRRHFVEVATGYEPDLFYPALTNTATEIYIPYGRNIVGTPNCTIYSAPELLLELASNPGVQYAFAQSTAFNIAHCSLSIEVKNFWIDERADYVTPFRVTQGGAFNLQHGYLPAGLNCSRLANPWVHGCYIDVDNWFSAWGSMSVNVYACVIRSDGVQGSVYPSEGCTLSLMKCYLYGLIAGVDATTNSIVDIRFENYFENCGIAIALADATLQMWDLGNGARFDSCDTLITGTGSIVYDGQTLKAWDAIDEIVIGATDKAALAELVAKTLQSRTSLLITYYDVSALVDTKDEYSNASSGLTAVRYQTAIDEVNSKVAVADLVYYVDGTAGDDLNDGLTWGTAKKTFTFLRETSGEVPRTINGSLTVNIRGAICSTDTSWNLNLKNFVVTQGVYIVGEMELVSTALAVNGYENNAAAIAYHSYITTTGAGWTPGEHRGRFALVKGRYYPIMNNSVDTLETVYLPNLAGTDTYAIYSPAEIRGALVTDPSTMIAYIDEYVEVEDTILSYCNFSNIHFNSNRSLSSKNNISVGNRTAYCNVDFSACAFNSGPYAIVFSEWADNVNNFNSCYFDVTGYSYLSALSNDSFYVFGCVFYSSALDGYGCGTEGGVLNLVYCRFYGQDVAVWGVDSKGAVSIYEAFFDSCNVCISVPGALSFGGANRFRNCTDGFYVLSGVTVDTAASFLVDTVTNEIKVSGTEVYSFSDIGSVSISNAASSASVNAYDVLSGLPVFLEEYDNTDSGLTAVRYQTAIDELASRTITSDLTMYVDGDAGSDANDGLTWGTAKKTFSFLYSGDSAAIPREINAILTVRCKGTLLSKDANRHTVLDGFYGSGQIVIEGEISDKVIGLTPTAWNNTFSDCEYHTFATVLGAGWTINEHIGDFIQFTTPASDTLYPIMRNTADTLETVNLPDLAGTEVFKIVQLDAIFKGAQVSAPTVLIEYPLLTMILTQSCTIYPVLRRVNVAKDNFMASGNRWVFWGQSAAEVLDIPLGWHYSNTSLVDECAVRHLTLQGPTPVVTSSAICAITLLNDSTAVLQDSNNSLGIKDCVFIADRTYLTLGLNLRTANVMLHLDGVRFYNYESAIFMGGGRVFCPQGVLIEGSMHGITLNNAVLDFYYGNIRFKNNSAAIYAMANSTILHCPEYQEIFYDSNVNDIVLWTSPSYGGISFAEFAVRTPCSNARTSSAVVYYDDIDGEYIKSLPEYDGSGSGITETSYQGAIDENALAITGRKIYNGIVDPNYVPASNPLPTHITTTTFTLGSLANPVTYYYRGERVVVSTNKTATLNDGLGGSSAGLYSVYLDGNTGNILATKAFPGITNLSSPIIAMVYWNGTNYGLVYEERHGYARDHAWHVWAHKWVGSRYGGGFTFAPTGTGLSATFTMTTGVVVDEDIEYPTPASAAWPTPHALRTWYQTGAATGTFDVTPSTVPFRAGLNGRPTYVNETGYVLTEAASAPNRYFNFFIFGVQDLHTPVYCFAETVSAAVAADNGYVSLSAARAIPFPNLSEYGLSPEMRPIYRLVVRADGVVQALTPADDYRLVTTLPQDAGVTSTNASLVAFTPVGGVSSTNVQLAIEELDAEKAPLASPTFTGTVTAAEATVTGNSDGSSPVLANVIFGTGDPPSAVGLPHGTIYIKHEA